MEKFTPGTWHCKFDAFDEALHITSDARIDGDMVEICSVSVGYNEPFEAEQQANATLIASVPELVEALKALADAARSACDATRHPALTEALSDADAALSKAGVS